MVGKIYIPNSVKFVSQQSGFAFFGAYGFGCAHFFYLTMEDVKMGFKFRKSKNIGGGFRLNMSKSGIGGSWGVKGFRVTKKAKGGFRTTISIPGTGISHSSDNKGCVSACITLCLV